MIRLRSASLLTIATLIAAADGQPPAPAPAAGPAEVHSAAASETISLANVADPKLVSAMKLFVTEDGGATWQMAQEIKVAENAERLPTFTFAAPKDGRYGLRTARADRSGAWEPAPQPGQQPNQILVVDRTAPVLERLEASSAVGGGGLTVQASWKAVDAGFAGDPVLIEASVDGGRTFQQVHSGPAEGSATIPLAITAATESVNLRLTARDRAGNVLTAPPRILAVPAAAKPVEPEQALAAAVGRLPAPADLAVDAKPATVPAVIAPSGEAPADASAPADAKPAAKAARAARPAPVPVNAPDTGRPVAPPEGTPYIFGAAAEDALEAAKALVADKPDEALDALLRLHESSVAKQAVAVELPLLRERGDLKTIIGVVENLPPEHVTDLARFERARALYAIGRYADAVRAAASVRADAPEARQAKLLIARALDAQQKPVEAGRIYDQLADGSDEAAAAARSER